MLIDRQEKPTTTKLIGITTAISLVLTASGCATSAGNIAAGYIIAVRPIDGDPENGYETELVAQKVGNVYWPTTVDVLTAATGANTIARITIPTQLWPYRVCVEGQQQVDVWSWVAASGACRKNDAWRVDISCTYWAMLT